MATTDPLDTTTLNSASDSDLEVGLCTLKEVHDEDDGGGVP